MFRQAPGSAPILRLFSSRPPSSNLSTAPRLRNSSSEWLKEEEVAIARSPGGSPHRETHTRSSSCALCTPGRRCSKRSEEHTSELQSRLHLVCRLLLEKKKINITSRVTIRMLLPVSESASTLSL